MVLSGEERKPKGRSREDTGKTSQIGYGPREPFLLPLWKKAGMRGSKGYLPRARSNVRQGSRSFRSFMNMAVVTPVQYRLTFEGH